MGAFIPDAWILLNEGLNALIGSKGSGKTALLECLRHPGPALTRAEEGRRRVLERYDWDILADRLERIWLDCAAH